VKIVVLGGYGVFGVRLCQLLARDGHNVVVAGRRVAPAKALAKEIGADHLVVDRAGDLSALWHLSPHTVVDAAGPFHAYGPRPYGLAEACIAHAVNYLDLCDDPAFCAGISALDHTAQVAGVFVLSGVSSVPAISSAAVTALAAGANEIDVISTAILPGNRAPRGRSVVASILNQCGQQMDVTVDGVSTQMRSWSAPEVFDLGQGIVRKGWTIAVPDQQLFPQAFGARTVMFRAGLELAVMNYALAAISWVRAKTGLNVPKWFVSLVMWVADKLALFGTDAGGMSVKVTTRQDGRWQQRTWRMIARSGDGPFIPAVPARAVLRDTKAVAHGARPAIGVVSLQAIEAAFADLDVTTDLISAEHTPVFAAFLREDFATLAPTIQSAHDVGGPRCWAGRSRVTRGTTLWSRFLARLFGFPHASENIPVTVTMTPKDGGEWWERRFGNASFWSFLKVRNGAMTERFGPLTFRLGLHVTDGQLFYPVSSGRIGPVPLPQRLMPISIAREFEKGGRFHFDVELRAPLTGALMVHYQGWLEPETSGLGD
jgi:saccharopine dehydrogenase-like NADP-dependent oxidoreductase